MMQRFILACLAITLEAVCPGDLLGGGPPWPLPDHPGNIFVTGEEVTLKIEGPDRLKAKLTDYEGRQVAEPILGEGRIPLGRLPVGYYELVLDGGARPTYLGVLQRLRAPTPPRSPIGLDVAMAWFYPPEKMGSVANLCALAGVNFVRDRLTWTELEPKRGEFARTTRYDDSARAQAGAGLKPLQVLHRSPDWANPNGKRFPLDLRDAFNFHRELARRWQGQVVAFEPWNEADIDVFGGHSGSEMASLQKAAYLGIKAGNPGAIACLNVFALHRETTLSDLHDNVAWPYFDTFNLHHYEKFDAYPRLYADFRAVSAGKPLWVTECSVPVKWRGDEKLKEPTPEDLRIQSERVPMVFAQSLHEGSEAVFYFLLPHYTEGETQFGILRPNLEPRPAYVALAAAGRLLTDAKPLGRLRSPDSSVRAFVFHASPDGKPARVLVAWCETNTVLSLPRKPLAAYDHLGRSLPVKGVSLKLGRAPVYALLPPNARLDLSPPPARPPLLPGTPSPLVLQALVPEEQLDLKQSAYRVEPGKATAVPIFLYNFGAREFDGTLRLAEVPEKWEVKLPGTARISGGGRQEITLELTPPGKMEREFSRVRIVGDFPGAGQTVLSLRFVAAGERSPAR